MGSIVKSIGKAIGKLAKGIGKLVKKALPIILMVGVAYMGLAAYGAMGSAASGASVFTPANAGLGLQKATSSFMGGVKNFFGGAFGGGQAMASTTGGMGGSLTAAASPVGMVAGPVAGASASATGATYTQDFSKLFTGATDSVTRGMGSGDAIADAMKYQSDMMWKGTLLKAGGAFISSYFDESDEIAKRQLDITEDEFKRRHTYGGFAMDSGKPSDYAKPGQPGHDPTGFWSQMGGPPQFGYPSGNKGGPRQFQQAGLKTPSVNRPGLINSRQGQRQTAGLLGQRNKSVA